MPDESTVRLLTSLRRYFTDQATEMGDHRDYYLGAAVAIETALKLLAGPPQAPSPNGDKPPTKRAAVARKPSRTRKPSYPCEGCEKVYTVYNSLKSHHTRHPDHRMT